MTETTLMLVSSGLRLGLQALEAAMRLNKEGYAVPELETFMARTDALRALPDLTPGAESGADAPQTPSTASAQRAKAGQNAEGVAPAEGGSGDGEQTPEGVGLFGLRRHAETTER
ncbi:hypothetical protein ACI3L3_10630 [Desulfobaculum sp. SPO524]|uniref:hypothetical protein n=1 Tax=Desulfobaculum sp. SPO524 TaxID=3378071 RepID=UPI0038520BFA